MSTHDRPQFAGLGESRVGIRAVLQERPSKYMMLMSFAQEILREDSHLSAVDREVIAAYTSKLNGCEYCCGSHTEFATSLGASDTDRAMIESGVTDGHRQAVHAAGFSEEELKDAVAVCAAFNLFNRIVEGHGIAPHESYVQDAKMINTHGYDRRR
ncbi:MAG: hypothetical protein EBT21_02745 [Actinobacteria bacterium]|nr:hypothetical protein [Actinomycetota bacterium]